MHWWRRRQLPLHRARGRKGHLTGARLVHTAWGLRLAGRPREQLGAVMGVALSGGESTSSNNTQGKHSSALAVRGGDEVRLLLPQVPRSS